MFHIRVQLVSSAFKLDCGLIVKYTEQEQLTITICLKKESAMESI